MVMKSPDTSHEPAVPPLSALTEAQLLEAMHAEFDRLNAEHFAGELIRPTVIISRRKAYGGYYQPQRHRIVLSWQAYREHGWEEALNTFRHEVAHIKHPNHSKAFWELASQLGVTKRYAASPLTPPRTPHRYVYGCPVCGRRVHRNRRIRQASCGVCDKNYNPKFALKLLSDDQR
ncbi:hypothetical protein CCAX7_47190 [Capsulimonas corticalis]|uniref:SprT-like domain-containing protein n=2 Tax=Capsulimonas corticalis TaxID=2219043 RepID=A0A402CQK0_9BACT|nr:hypothetical protein CCAX7_47190 [Capsulimonas corticalis]